MKKSVSYTETQYGGGLALRAYHFYKADGTLDTPPEGWEKPRFSRGAWKTWDSKNAAPVTVEAFLGDRYLMLGEVASVLSPQAARTAALALSSPASGSKTKDRPSEPATEPSGEQSAKPGHSKSEAADWDEVAARVNARLGLTSDHGAEVKLASGAE